MRPRILRVGRCSGRLCRAGRGKHRAGGPSPTGRRPTDQGSALRRSRRPGPVGSRVRRHVRRECRQRGQASLRDRRVDPRGVGLSDPLRCLSRAPATRSCPSTRRRRRSRRSTGSARRTGRSVRDVSRRTRRWRRTCPPSRWPATSTSCGHCWVERKLHSWCVLRHPGRRQLCPPVSAPHREDGAGRSGRSQSRSHERAKDQAIGFDRALRRAVASCIEREAHCPLGRSVKEGIESVQLIVAAAESGLLRVPGGDRPLAEGEVDQGVGLEPVRLRTLAPPLRSRGQRSPG